MRMPPVIQKGTAVNPISSTASGDTGSDSRALQDSGLTIDVLHAGDHRDALGIWRTFEETLNDVPLMCSADWTAAWLQAFGDVIPHWFVIGRDSQTGAPAGICLITRGVAQKDGPVPVRSLHLGTAGEPDEDSVCVEYNDVLTAPAFRSQFCARLREFLNTRPGADQWNLDGVTEDLAAAFDRPDAPLLRRQETTYWFDLAAARRRNRTVLEDLRSATRRKIRRAREAAGELTVEWSDSLPVAIDIFEELMDLHQAHWNAQGKPGCYSSRRFTAFHEALITHLIPRNQMAFVRVRAEGQTLGCVQLLLDRNRALVYQCGRTSRSDVSSPGVLTDYLAMEECLARGIDAYDFLPVATQHKRHLSNSSRSIIWARKRHRRLRFVLLDTARQLKHSKLLQKLRTGMPGGARCADRNRESADS